MTYFNVQGCFDSQESLLSLIDKLASQQLVNEPLIELVDHTQFIMLSPGLRALFKKLSTGRIESNLQSDAIHTVVLNPRYQIV